MWQRLGRYVHVFEVSRMKAALILIAIFVSGCSVQVSSPLVEPKPEGVSREEVAAVVKEINENFERLGKAIKDLQAKK